MSTDALGQALLTLARNAIARRFVLPVQPLADLSGLPELAQPGATFVTLMQAGQLRGCIGSLEAYRPLSTDVAENAIAAAFHDPRFSPLGAEEFARTDVEVSLLAPAEAMQFTDEADALARLRPGIDGVILTRGQRRATFLPQGNKPTGQSGRQNAGVHVPGTLVARHRERAHPVRSLPARLQVA
jgi:AmmeMemoRadiSam system protein A